MRRTLLALWLLAFPAQADTLVVTFDFAADAQSFVATPGAFVTQAWASGSLSNDRPRKAATGASSTWARTTTWTGLGVPSGATITGVTSASMQSKCTVFTSAGTPNTSGAVTLVDGATTITLSAQRSITGTDGAFVTTNGTDATGLSLAAANSITLTIPDTMTNTNVVGSDVTILQDNLTFTITYTPAVAGTTRNSLSHAGG